MCTTEKGEWIAHRLPRAGELNVWNQALVTTKDHLIKIAFWSGSAWEIEDAGWCGSDEVIAWQPLPEPYRKEVRNESV